MKYRQNRSVAGRIEEFVRMPTRGEWASLGFTVAHDTGDYQVRIVECRAIGVSERITQLPAFMDRTRSFRGDMNWNAIGPRELPEKTSQSLSAALDIRIRLRVGTLEVAMRHKPGAAMPRAYDINHVQIVLFDQSIKVNIDKVQSGCRAPMPQQPRFYVFAGQWDFE